MPIYEARYTETVHRHVEIVSCCLKHAKSACGTDFRERDISPPDFYGVEEYSEFVEMKSGPEFETGFLLEHKGSGCSDDCVLPTPAADGGDGGKS